MLSPVPVPRAAALTVASLILIACGGSGIVPPPPACGAGSRDQIAMDVVDAVRPQAARGTATFTTTGSTPLSLTMAAGGGWTRVGFKPVSVLDAFVTGSDGSPSGELFIYIADTIGQRQIPLVPVSLPAVRSKTFTPPGSFVIYADRYDAAVGDYTRWLASESGCLTVSRVDTGSVGRAAGSLTLRGSWQTQTGTSLGSGDAMGTFEVPVLRLPPSSNALRDTVLATTTGARSDALVVPSQGTGNVQSYQELTAGAPRLVIAASAPKADSTRELLFSVPGVPLTADSVPLAQPTIDEARAARSLKPFAMLQVNTADPLNPQTSVIRQLWRSTGGPADYVRFTNIVQTGPLTFCGYATGRFRFDATGDNPQTAPPTPLGAPLTASGSFATVVTILKPSNTVTATSADMILGQLAARSIAVSGTPLKCAH